VGTENMHCSFSCKQRILFKKKKENFRKNEMEIQKESLSKWTRKKQCVEGMGRDERKTKNTVNTGHSSKHIYSLTR
jgi:hypothetical protein